MHSQGHTAEAADARRAVPSQGHTAADANARRDVLPEGHVSEEADFRTAVQSPNLATEEASDRTSLLHAVSVSGGLPSAERPPGHASAGVGGCGSKAEPDLQGTQSVRTEPVPLWGENQDGAAVHAVRNNAPADANAPPAVQNIAPADANALPSVQNNALSAVQSNALPAVQNNALPAAQSNAPADAGAWIEAQKDAPVEAASAVAGNASASGAELARGCAVSTEAQFVPPWFFKRPSRGDPQGSLCSLSPDQGLHVEGVRLEDAPPGVAQRSWASPCGTAGNQSPQEAGSKAQSVPDSVCTATPGPSAGPRVADAAAVDADNGRVAPGEARSAAVEDANAVGAPPDLQHEERSRADVIDEGSGVPDGYCEHRKGWVPVEGLLLTSAPPTAGQATSHARITACEAPHLFDYECFIRGLDCIQPGSVITYEAAVITSYPSDAGETRARKTRDGRGTSGGEDDGGGVVLVLLCLQLRERVGLDVVVHVVIGGEGKALLVEEGFSPKPGGPSLGEHAAMKAAHLRSLDAPRPPCLQTVLWSNKNVVLKVCRGGKEEGRNVCCGQCSVQSMGVF